MVSDGGGAVVIASPQVARNTRQTPVWIIGSGEATKYRENNADITVSAGAQAGPMAFGDAGVSPAEIDVLMAYDSFTITVMCLIEDLGFCKKGEGGAYVERRPSRLRRSAQAGAEYRRWRSVLESPRAARHFPAAGSDPATPWRVPLAGARRQTRGGGGQWRPAGRPPRHWRHHPCR